MPNVVILAGPNGAGKTSAAPLLLREEYRVAEFVNADVIARGLSAFSSDAFDSADIAIARVRRRVAQGGHSVSPDVIRRRYERGLANFANRYRDAADEWQLYDNTGSLDRRTIARGRLGTIEVFDRDRWARFEQAVARIARVREARMADRNPIPDDHLARCFRDSAALERAMTITFARVIRRHRLLNEPIIVGRDGQVVELDPHTVPMPEGVTEEQMGPVFDYL